jgi:hypothetical protein
MTDSTEPTPINGPAPDQPDNHPPAIEDVIANLCNAMAHAVSRLDDLDATMDDVRDGLETIIQKLGHIHAMNKRQEVTLARIEKAIDDDPPDESQDSGGGAGF